jgi:hypothetical protein
MSIEISKAIETFVSANQNLLGNLWGRWQDEKEYEDINEYGAVIAKNFPEGWKLIKSAKRPFGVTVQIEQEQWQVSVTGRSMGWKRIK